MTLTPEQEAALVARARADPEGFGELYDQYFPQIYRFVASRVGSQDQAEAVTSDVFYKALRAIPRYRPSGHPFSSWLYQIAVNSITDHYRSRRRQAESLEEQPERPTPGPGVDEAVGNRLGLDEIGQAIAALPEHQRTALILKYQEDLPLLEIARIMGKSEGAVKLLIFRGTATLRSQLRPRLSEVSRSGA